MPKLGEILLQTGLITPAQLAQALAQQKVEGGRLGAILIKLGCLTEQQVVQALGEKFRLPYIDLDRHAIDAALLQLIPAEIAQKHLVFPVAKTGTTLTLAMADPVSAFAVEDIRFMTGLKVELVVATESGVRRAIDRFYEDAESLQTVIASMEGVGTEVMDEPGDLNGTIGELKQAVEDAPVIRLVNLMLAEAIRRGASDIHAEPVDKTFSVRFRIDGVLYEVMSPAA